MKWRDYHILSYCKEKESEHKVIIEQLSKRNSELEKRFQKYYNKFQKVKDLKKELLQMSLNLEQDKGVLEQFEVQRSDSEEKIETLTQENSNYIDLIKKLELEIEEYKTYFFTSNFQKSDSRNFYTNEQSTVDIYMELENTRQLLSGNIFN